MNNLQLSISDREQTRNDFSESFLQDVIAQVQHGVDPRNSIGINCGVSFGRVLQIFQDRMFNFPRAS